MNSRKLILIFGIFYCFSLGILSYERMILKTVKAVSDGTSELLRKAAEAGAKTLAASVYEETPVMRALDEFRAVLDADKNDITISELCEVCFYLNERELSAADGAGNAVKGDIVTVVVYLRNMPVPVPGRSYWLEKTVRAEAVLD